LIGTKSLNTLIDYRFKKHFKAKKGRSGSGRNRTGASGEDLMLKLPLGTEILINDDVIADVTSTDKIILFPGGRGGKGNINFKSSTNRAPRKTTPGEKGHESDIVLRLKILADVGLVGSPNAGKSSLLRKISAAKPKVADYPFTTLEPKLGVVRTNDDEVVVADIPGLLSGAHKGNGLGFQFLKHIERCKSIIHLIDVTNEDIINEYNTICEELDKYDQSIKKKQKIIALNKCDLITNTEITTIKKDFENKLDKNVHMISAISGYGIDKITKEILKIGK